VWSNLRRPLYARARPLLTSVHVVLALGFAMALGRRILAPASLIDSDFMVFRSAWWLILHGQGAFLYDAFHQRAAQHVLMGGAEFQGGLMAFLNPPHAALAGVPLGWIADRAGLAAAFALWTAINLLMVVRLDAGIRAVLGANRGEARWTATFALLAFYPLFYTMFIGQLSVLLALATFELFRAMKAERPCVAAAWLLVLSIKPQLVAPFVVLLMVRGDWRTLRWSLAGASIAAMLSAAALGPSIWFDYLRNLHGLEQFFAAGTPPHMMNVRGALTRLSGSRLSLDTVYTLSVGAWAIAIAALAFVLAPRRRTEQRDLRADFALTVGVALFFSPHLFQQDALLWVVPLSLHAAWLRQHRQRWERYWIFIGLWPLVFIVASVIDARHPGGPLLVVSPAVAVMLGALVEMGRSALTVNGRTLRAVGPETC
jgi:hypothetical protein